MAQLTTLSDELTGRQPVRENFVMLSESEADAMSANITQQTGQSTSAPIDVQGDVSVPAANQAQNIDTMMNLDVPIPPSELVNTPELKEPTAEQRSANALTKIQEQQKQDSIDAKNSQRLLATAEFAINISNALSAYNAFQQSTISAIQNKRFQANNAFINGKQRALEAIQEGERAQEDILLKQAAQGQDVSGVATESLQRSYATIAAYNAMQVESNAYREMLGYDLEEIALEFGLEQKKQERNVNIINSALRYGANMQSTF
jgi:hypothetical protein